MKTIKNPLAFLAFTYSISLMMGALGYLNDSQLTLEISAIVFVGGSVLGLFGLGIGLMRAK